MGRWTQRPRVGPETGVSSSGAPRRAPQPRGWAALSVSPSALRGCPATSPRATPSRGRRLPPPAGPSLASAPPSAPKPCGVARGPGFGRSPGLSCPWTPRYRQAASGAAGAGRPRAREDPARAARVAAPTPPGPGLTRPGSVKMALGSRGRETEAGEARTSLSHGAGQWRAASNPGSHLKPSAGRVLSHPHLPAMETLSPPLAPSRPPLPAPPTPPAEPSLSPPRPRASSGRAPTQPSRPDVASWPPNWAPGVARFLLLGLPTSACAILGGLQRTRNAQALPVVSPR